MRGNTVAQPLTHVCTPFHWSWNDIQRSVRRPMNFFGREAAEGSPEFCKREGTIGGGGGLLADGLSWVVDNG